ncbi:MAG TPA: methyltransferase, partial [Microbacterium sp.]|uniref:methyltransferase n=1 Tax=Microbacterium sp. TaxID=51671 RepID=UPI002BF45814
VASALDLGCGCGILALHLSRSAARVVATDISARALRFTALNAALNGASGIETRRGSLFEPVQGEVFERIAANPPFVITPRVDGVPGYEYRDGGLEGDALMAAVVGTVGDHLTPGGVATLLGNWETRDGASGLDRARGWVDAAPVRLDAWVIERERLDPARYAELWVRDGGTRPGSTEYDALLGAWLDDFERRGVSGIGMGWVVLRRPGGAVTLARYEKIGHAPGRVAGLISHALAAHDRLEAIGDDGLAASTLLVASDVTEARHHLPGEEGPSVLELRQGGGLARTVPVDPALAAVVGACDGELPVGALIDAVAQLLEVGPEELRGDLLPRLRELVFTGFLSFS